MTSQLFNNNVIHDLNKIRRQRGKKEAPTLVKFMMDNIKADKEMYT